MSGPYPSIYGGPKGLFSSIFGGPQGLFTSLFSHAGAETPKNHQRLSGFGDSPFIETYNKGTTEVYKTLYPKKAFTSLFGSPPFYTPFKKDSVYSNLYPNKVFKTLFGLGSGPFNPTYTETQSFNFKSLYPKKVFKTLFGAEDNSLQLILAILVIIYLMRGK